MSYINAHKLREVKSFIEKVIGFCVAFRQDKPCWKEHQDVGVLFSLAKKELEALESVGGEVKPRKIGVSK